MELVRKKPKPGKPESGEYGSKEVIPGLCLSMDDVSFLCAENTTFGMKLKNVTQTCSGAHAFKKEYPH